VADVDDGSARLDALLDHQEAGSARVFRAAVAALRSDLDLNELADLIAQGRVADALDRLRHVAEELGAASNLAFVASGRDTASFLTGAGVGRVTFDQVNVGAVAAMQRNTLSLVREFTAEQARATSAALVSGVEAGTNPTAQARDFRDSIGLTERQWGHVASYRAALGRVGLDDQAQQDALGRALRDRRHDAQVLHAARDARPIPPAKVDQMVERYAARYVAHRSRVIGRTEALRAVHQGNEESYRQAIEAGTIDADKLTRKWVTRLDGRERESHLLLNDQERGWGEPWITAFGALRYPGDPDAPARETIQCRCVIATRIRTR
jgi:hypothetical protein